MWLFSSNEMPLQYKTNYIQTCPGRVSINPRLVRKTEHFEMPIVFDKSKIWKEVPTNPDKSILSAVVFGRFLPSLLQGLLLWLDILRAQGPQASI